MDRHKLLWQSKAVLLLVLPAVAADLVLEAYAWAAQAASVAVWTLGLSGVLGLIVWRFRSATPWAAAIGALITASLIFSTATFRAPPWQTALMPLLALLLLTSSATRIGRRRKEQLGTAERRSGRNAAQVAANLGVAALFMADGAQTWMLDQPWLKSAPGKSPLVFAVGLAAMCEAAADTVSSEIGQLLSSRPRMLTTFRLAQPGEDGAISLAGTIVGVLAAGIVALIGALALNAGARTLAVSWIGGIFGFFFDSLLGATLERRAWLNNDAVNFLSTLSAAVFALALIAALPHFGLL